ncbi:Probable thiol oxidoreductase with 2 cytochrome c heme-binding sites [Bathymodiolus heckerae thiotrophic gill symbiont]|nr:Probable thiol oxidoreductase with 2 cytochrome c heme-binding sites [Bathymodiolus heckerae thiotrophic gill symbiont]
MVKRLNFNRALLLALILGIVLMPRVFAVSIKAFNEDRFILGKSFFEKPWVAFPASTTARDGLGPLFNQNACVNCHPKGGRSNKFVVKLDNPNTIYGGQISTQSAGNVPAEAKVAIDYQMYTAHYANGDKVVLKKPVVKLSNLGYGKVDSTLSVRISPSLHGLGLLASIPNKPVKRFNLSASEPSILAQAANAAHNDMGLSNPLYPQENCTNKQEKCNNAPKSNSLDLPQHRLKAIAYFVKSLDKVSAVKPIKLFAKIGCSRCHTPSYVLEKRTIYPYSDLLVHNLGEGDFRTAPLWSSKKAPNFWHDGRASTVEEAILWHGGEAQSAKESFVNLSKKDRVQFIRFIENM